MKKFPVLPTLFLALAAPAFAAEAPPRTEAEILKSVKVPDGYEATVFALPPTVGYPTAVSASADGVLFIAIDENGSLDAKPGRGRVLRCIDSDGDGKADQFTTFAEMDSPRGVIWDGPSGAGPGTLYVMHPPNLTAYTDTDGDGKADKVEEVVTGLGFDLKFRGADHTTNGCRMGIDGFIYIACGDYGYVEAKGKDGTTIKHRGGSIVRVRPDGTGLEIVVQGTRNIYDVAVAPTLDLFTRDNTNDGDGWNDRLSFNPPGAHMGYPSYYMRFHEDMLEPLADYGGGSPCGSLWLDEPGLQNGLYTVEWGRSAIFYHPLQQTGAGYALDGPNQGQQEWLKLTRPTDMDVDAAGRIYISSWEGATFNYNGPNAGYVLRVMKKGATAAANVDFKKAADAQLAAAIGSPSAVIRLGAQREILRRGPKPEFAAPLRKIAETAGSTGPRVAALETLAQLFGAKAFPSFTQLAADETIREYAVRALAEDTRLAAQVPMPPLTAGLSDKNPRVRTAAINAVRRLGKTDAAQAMLPLVADADPVVSHLAVRALAELKAAAVLVGALDSADAKVQPGALRALYGFYDEKVADALIARLATAKDSALRKGLLNTLCRLDNQDAPYLDPKVWWGTRPDTSGPVYKPERWAASDKIEAALKAALDTEQGEDGRWLVQTMYKTKVNFPGLVELMLAKAGTDTAAKLTAIEGLFGKDNALPAEGLAALSAIAADEKQAPDFRAKALRLFARASERGAALDAAFAAFAPFAGANPGHASIAAAFEEFTRDAKHTKHLAALEKIADSGDAPKRTLAQTVLVNLATSTLVKGKDHDAATAAVEKSWAKPAAAASLLGVIARTKAKDFAGQVSAHLKDPDNAVAEAALFAYQSLGMKDTGTPAAQIGTMKYEAVFAAVQKGGDAAQGKDMFLRAGCIACHTTRADEPPKGPMLAAVAKTYDRAALTESILKPSAKIAQGFETTTLKTKAHGEIQGFITREGADSVDLRNVTGQTVTIEKGDITTRGKLDQSMMPEGLLNTFAPADLANLLAFLESLKAQ